MNIIIKKCIQNVKCFCNGIPSLFNRLIECCRSCKGQPKAKKSLQDVDLMLETEPKKQELKNRAVQTVYLLSENHYNPQDHEFKIHVLQLVAKKHFAYAMEGLEREETEEKEMKQILNGELIGMRDADFFGLEDPLFNIFNTAIDLNLCLRDLQDQEIVEGKENDMLLALTSKVNQGFLKSFWSLPSKNNVIFEFLQKNKNRLCNLSLEEKGPVFNLLISKWKSESWIKLTEMIAVEIAPTVKQILPAQKHSTIETILQCFKTAKISMEYLNLLHITLRDDIMGKNLIEILNLISKNKALVAILGEAHIPGIKKFLEEKEINVLGKSEFLKMANS